MLTYKLRDGETPRNQLPAALLGPTGQGQDIVLLDLGEGRGHSSSQRSGSRARSSTSASLSFLSDLLVPPIEWPQLQADVSTWSQPSGTKSWQRRAERGSGMGRGSSAQCHHENKLLAHPRVAITNSVSQGWHLNYTSWQIPPAHARSMVCSPPLDIRK